MESSLFSAQVQFVDDYLALIHIPLDIYPFYMRPILQLLFHGVPPLEEELENRFEPTTTFRPSFLSISITPVECSVICSRDLVDRYFSPLLSCQDEIHLANSRRVEISSEDYVVMQVEGQGLDAGQRVLELTSPLSMAGVSILFVSTYFSDYILFPRHSKNQVIRALESRGFAFEASSETYSAQPQFQRSYPSPKSKHASPPGTPPPSSLTELQARTFASLREHSVIPHVDRELRIVQCAVHYREPGETASFASFRPSLIAALLIDNPQFLSLTVTATDPSASLLFEKRLLPRFSTNERGDPLLLGAKDEVLIPITLDLREVPLEATGIVCGVAGRMAAANTLNPHENHDDFDLDALFETAGDMTRQQPLHQFTDNPSIAISFLSTTRASSVIVREEELSRAMASLETMNDKEIDPLSEEILKMSL